MAKAPKAGKVIATPPVSPPATVPTDIYEKTIALALDRSKFGNRRKVLMSTVDVVVSENQINPVAAAINPDAPAANLPQADKNMLSLSKKLLKSAELKAINTIDNDAANYLFDVCVPSFFKPGIHLVPLKAVPTVDAKLTDFATARAVLVDAFIAAYPDAIESMRATLGPMFNEAEYPTPDEMRRQFAFSWRYLNLGAPTQLKTVSAKLFAVQAAQIEAQVTEAALEIRQMMRATMQELVAHIADRLTPGVDGKPKTFRDTLIERFNTFVDNFEMRNVTNDTELQALVASAKSLVSGVDAGILREDANARATIATGIEAIKATLDTMVITGGRAINLDDDAPVGGIMTAAKKAALTRSRKAAAAPSATAAA